MRYVFHYDESRKAEPLSEHELYKSFDGKACGIYEEPSVNGIVEAFFEDGSEINVFFDELTELKEV